VAKRILIVEDDPISRKLARDVLTANGFDVAEAESGESALAQAEASRFDLVVMDIQLPGIDGVHTIGALRARAETESVPVLAVTAHAMPGDEARILASGCQRYLPKPLKFAEFVDTVREMLDAPAA
jgi:two-component system cell cycle response regulator DivK